MFLFESSLIIDKKIKNCCTKEMVIIRVNLKDVHTNSSYKLLPKSDGGNNSLSLRVSIFSCLGKFILVIYDVPYPILVYRFEPKKIGVFLP